MKKLIRKKVYETNSSSAHSISLGIDELKSFVLDSLLPNDEGNIILTGGEFGWSYQKFNDALTKANYAVASKVDKKILKELIIEQTGANDVIFSTSEDYNSSNYSYVDHQSVGTCPTTKSELKDFIFNKNSWLFTGNDNSSPPPAFYNVEEYSIQEGRQTVKKVDFKFQIVFKHNPFYSEKDLQILEEMNQKFIDFPTAQDLENMLSFFDFRYNKTKRMFEKHSCYWAGNEEYFEADYNLEQKDPTEKGGSILLVNKNALSTFDSSLDKQNLTWEERREWIREFLADSKNLMSIEFDIVKL